MSTAINSIAVSFVCATLISPSIAESCTSKIDPKKPIDAIIACLGQLEAENEKLRGSGPVLAQDTNALVLKLVAELDALKTEIAPLRALLQGAVVAFDRSQTEGTCPAGWKLFEPAGGRFIVGAGTHENKDLGGNDLTNHPAFKDKPTVAVGGEEKHKLEIAEMPSHSHSIARHAAKGNNDVATFEGATALDNQPATGAQGGGQSHNTMPPYVALYYCINVKN